MADPIEMTVEQAYDTSLADYPSDHVVVRPAENEQDQTLAGALLEHLLYGHPDRESLTVKATRDKTAPHTIREIDVRRHPAGRRIDKVLVEFDEMMSALDRCGCCATMTPCHMHGGKGRSWGALRSASILGPLMDRFPVRGDVIRVPRGRAMSSQISNTGIVPASLTVSGSFRLTRPRAIPQHPLVKASRSLRAHIGRGAR